MDCSGAIPEQLDHLHRSHDGPVPRPVLRIVLGGGPAAVSAAEQAAALAVQEVLAAEARIGAVRRRQMLSAHRCGSDDWLARLAATLAHHRAAAVRLRAQRKAYSQ